MSNYFIYVEECNVILCSYDKVVILMLSLKQGRFLAVEILGDCSRAYMCICINVESVHSD